MAHPTRFIEGVTGQFPEEGPLFPGPIYPGYGYPPRPGEDRPGLSPFGRLAKGGNLGKSSILIYDKKATRPQSAPVDMINIKGDDVDACQMIITLHRPRAVVLAFDDMLMRLDQQNNTGEVTNQEVEIDDFPGTHHSIIWPPLEAFIEFGTGGVSEKVAVDYLNGQTVSVTASFLRVHAQVSQFEDPDGIFGTSAAYYTAAHVGPGFARNHVTRTIYCGVLDVKEESDVISLPGFAERAQLVGARINDHSPTLTEGWLRFFQSPDGTNNVGDFFISDSTPRNIDIPNGAQYFSVINRSGHHLKMSVVFGLGL